MGTDIHMAAEVRNDEGEWEFIPGPIIDCWACDGTGMKIKWNGRVKVHSATEPCMWCCTKPEDEEDHPFDREYTARRYVGPGKVKDHWYSERNYTVFAILGNVRNGSGFAGVYTHDPIPFISDCRGVPDDVTKETLDALSNEHSATWCSLTEVMDYDWHAPVHRGGVISLEQYAFCKASGKRPGGWSGSISGPKIITVNPLMADRFLLAGVDVEDQQVYVQYEWDDTLDEYTEHFLSRMKMLAMETGEHECRLVYDFDS